MIILQLSTVKTWAGGEVHFYDLVQGLRQRGHRVLAVCTAGSCLAERLPAEDKFYISCGLKGIMRLAAVIKENGAEIVHAHAGRDYRRAVIAAALAGGCKVVLTRHILLPLKKDFISRRLWDRAAKFIAVSQSVADVLTGENNIPADRLAVIHNGIDLTRHRRILQSKAAIRKKYGLALAKTVIGCAGRLAAEKGQADLIRAFKQVSRLYPDTLLCLAGSGEDEGRLKALTLELGLGDKVIFLGFIKEMAEFMFLLDVFVLSSKNEPFGLVVLEAMAQGVPLVARRAGGVREILQQDRTGILVDSQGIEPLAEGIVQVLSDYNGAEARAENAYRALLADFTLERMLDKTEKLYYSLL